MKLKTFILSGLLATMPAAALADSSTDSANWPLIRDSLFPGSPEIVESDDVVTLEAPTRALDAALVPIAVKVKERQDAPNPIEKIYLIIDNNPSPIVGTFDMTPNIGIADLSTRVRINAYSPVRVIAQTQDGKLHMNSRFVKASGGCSAPAGADDILARQRMGQMKLKQREDGEDNALQLLISHPNYSGLQIDQLTRHWIPSDYVSDINITLDGEPVMSFNGGISISENPAFTFHMDKDKSGTLKADVKDSTGREFSSQWDISSQ